MKRYFFLILISLVSFSSFAQSNDVKIESFKVEGNCGMCKKRIEDAAYIKGVKRADWDKDKSVLTVVYRPSKTNVQVIQQSIAKAGHTSAGIAATDADYKKLPECCQYKTHSCEH